MPSATLNETLLERHGTLPAISSTEIVIEAWSEHCDSPLFPPLMQKLRGRWDLTKFPGESMHEAVSRMPGPIPGIRLGVDPVNRTCRLFDPLDTDEFAELWRKLVRHYDDYDSHLTRGQKWPQNLMQDCGPSTIKTWLFWMRRLVDGGMAKAWQRAARLPTLREIDSLPGKTQISQGNAKIAYPIFKEDLNEFGMLKKEICEQGFIDRGEGNRSGQFGEWQHGQFAAAPAVIPQPMSARQMLDELRAMGYEIGEPKGSSDGDSGDNSNGPNAGPSGDSGSRPPDQGGRPDRPNNPAGPPRKNK